MANQRIIEQIDNWRVGYLPPLPEPTEALPGTEEKIIVMKERYERGQAIHHPEDRRYVPDEDEGRG